MEIAEVATSNKPSLGPSVGRFAYRVAEVATLLGLSRTRIYQLTQTGALPCIKVGGAVLIPADRLREWLAEGRS